jgi:hypothetical protein
VPKECDTHMLPVPEITSFAEQLGSLDVMPKLMRLMSVKTRRRDRISADEEERQRAGHEIVTTLRFVPHGVRAGQLPSTVTVDGEELATMTYGDTALIRRMNVGLRRRKDPNIRGYLLDTHEGRWARDADLVKNETDEGRIQQVIPCCGLEDFDRRLELAALAAQLAQLPPLLARHARRLTGVDLGLAHPLAQRLRVHPSRPEIAFIAAHSDS